MLPPRNKHAFSPSIFNFFLIIQIFFLYLFSIIKWLLTQKTTYKTHLQIFAMEIHCELYPLIIGFHEPPCAVASMVLNLVEIYTTINSNFRLFKKNILNTRFYDKKPLVTY